MIRVHILVRLTNYRFKDCQLSQICSSGSASMLACDWWEDNLSAVIASYDSGNFEPIKQSLILIRIGEAAPENYAKNMTEVIRLDVRRYFNSRQLWNILLLEFVRYPRS